MKRWIHMAIFLLLFFSLINMVSGASEDTSQGTAEVSTQGGSILPLPISYFPLKNDKVVFYPVTQEHFKIRYLIYNNRPFRKTVTVHYWLSKDNETIWWNTKTVSIDAYHELEVELQYPVHKEGTYTACAKIVEPEPESGTLCYTFKVESGLTPVIPLALIFVAFFIGVVVIDIYYTKRKKKEEK